MYRHSPGHEGTAGGGALRLGVEVGEAHPFTGEFVQAGCGNQAAVATQITPADVISQHKNNIWFVGHD